MSRYDAAYIDATITEDPRILDLPRAMRFVHVEAYVYCAQQHTDGHIPKGALRRLTDEDDAVAAAEALVDAGAWEAVDAGYQIVGYLDSQISSERVAQLRGQARQRWERYQDRRGQPQRVSKRVEERVANASPNGTRVNERVSESETNETSEMNTAHVAPLRDSADASSASQSLHCVAAKQGFIPCTNPPVASGKRAGRVCGLHQKALDKGSTVKQYDPELMWCFACGLPGSKGFALVYDEDAALFEHKGRQHPDLPDGWARCEACDRALPDAVTLDDGTFCSKCIRVGQEADADAKVAS